MCSISLNCIRYNDRSGQENEDGEKGEEDGEEIHGWEHPGWDAPSLYDSGGDGKRVVR